MIQRYLIADEPAWWPAFDGITDVTKAAGIDYLLGELDSPDPSDQGPEHVYVLTRP
ncbi:MAG TPA: hypothetical protein VG650_02645 [Mycobacteriales bacterium]|nr:hypothetical protein [Mycobacteriales bacterium]